MVNVTVKLNTVRIGDGDSTHDLYDEFHLNISFAHIDAPKRKQEFGKVT